MSSVLYKGCTNCGSKNFRYLGNADNKESHLDLTVARKTENGDYEPVDKSFIITPFICDDCHHISFYSSTAIEK